MQFNSLKDLEKLLKLCKKHGVSEVSTPDISFKLNPPDRPAPVPFEVAPELDHVAAPGGIAASTKILPDNFKIDTPDDLSEEQRLFYSAEGVPEQANQ